MNDDLLAAAIANVELLRLAALGLAQDNRDAQALADYADSVVAWLVEQQQQTMARLH